MNIAEIELSALARGCLARRIPDRETLSRELLVWETHRNNLQKRIVWHLTSSDARLKLRKLYPTFHD